MFGALGRLRDGEGYEVAAAREDTLEILDGGGAPQVEQIAADADVASAVSLAGGDVGEGVFDGGAAAEQGAARPGLLELSVLALPGFVGGDGDGAAIARRGLGALRAQWACAARFGVELDGVAGLERLHLASGAGDRLGAQVDLEVALGEQAGSVRALSPRAWRTRFRPRRRRHRRRGCSRRRDRYAARRDEAAAP